MSSDPPGVRLAAAAGCAVASVPGCPRRRQPRRGPSHAFERQPLASRRLLDLVLSPSGSRRLSREVPLSSPPAGMTVGEVALPDAATSPATSAGCGRRRSRDRLPRRRTSTAARRQLPRDLVGSRESAVEQDDPRARPPARGRAVRRSLCSRVRPNQQRRATVPARSLRTSQGSCEPVMVPDWHHCNVPRGTCS